MKKGLILLWLGFCACGDDSTAQIANNANNSPNNSTPNNTNNGSNSATNNGSNSNTNNSTSNNATNNNATNNNATNNEVPEDLILRCRQESDGDLDGNPDVITTYDYNAKGQTTLFRYLVVANQAESEEGVYFYEDGLKTRLEVDTGLDQTIDYFYTYTYDENRLLSGEVYEETTGRRVNKVFENSGDETLQRSDFDADGIFEQQLFTRYYNRELNKYALREGREQDGTPRFRETYTYDDQGRLVTFLSENIVGARTNSGTYTYEGSVRTYRLDLGNEGVVDEIHTRIEGEFGPTENTLRKANGDLISQSIWEYQNEGLKITARYDNDGDGQIDVIGTQYFAVGACPNPEL